jgi:hypothetical protein
MKQGASRCRYGTRQPREGDGFDIHAFGLGSLNPVISGLSGKS